MYFAKSIMHWFKLEMTMNNHNLAVNRHHAIGHKGKIFFNVYFDAILRGCWKTTPMRFDGSFFTFICKTIICLNKILCIVD